MESYSIGKNIIFECPSYSLPRDWSSFTDVSQTENNLVLWRKRFVSFPGAWQIPTVLLVRVHIMKPKC